MKNKNLKIMKSVAEISAREIDMRELQSVIDGLTDEEKFEFDIAVKEREFVMSLRNKREQKGLTQQQLADKIGLKQQSVCRMEKVGSNPSLSNLIKYLTGLDVDIMDLVRE